MVKKKKERKLCWVDLTTCDLWNTEKCSSGQDLGLEHQLSAGKKCSQCSAKKLQAN
jgi:hypothetical protein